MSETIKPVDHERGSTKKKGGAGEDVILLTDVDHEEIIKDLPEDLSVTDINRAELYLGWNDIRYKIDRGNASQAEIDWFENVPCSGGRPLFVAQLLREDVGNFEKAIKYVNSKRS